MSDLANGTYPARATSWIDDTATVGGEDKAILKVSFVIEGQTVDWTCWIDDMYNDKNEPSANLRGLLALGVTKDDLRVWAQGGALAGLDRNEVNCVVDEDKNGYTRVHYVNDPNDRGVRQARPLDRAQRAQVAQKMAQALSQLGGAQRAPEPPPRGGTYGGPPRGGLPPRAGAATGHSGPPYGTGDDDIPF